MLRTVILKIVVALEPDGKLKHLFRGPCPQV